MDYGKIVLNIDYILQKKGISKNQLCRDLSIPRTNLNKYCRNEFQRIDGLFICKLCFYFEIGIEELMQYFPPQKNVGE